MGASVAGVEYIHIVILFIFSGMPGDPFVGRKIKTLNEIDVIFSGNTEHSDYFGLMIVMI